MTLIKVRHTQVASLPLLWRLTLKSIYEPDKLTLDQEYLLKHSFIYWVKKIDKNEDEQYCLEFMADLIKQDSDGKLKERKHTFKIHNIDYRKFHRLPEAYDYSYKNMKRIHNILEMERARRN